MNTQPKDYPVRLGVLSDIHFPDHHPRAWPLALKILPELNLDRLLLLGDIMEMEPFSRFLVLPQKRMNLKHDVKVAKRELTRLRTALPSIPMEMMGGNHEDHLDRYIYHNAPALADDPGLTLRDKLNLDDFDIQWRPHGKKLTIGKLNFLHGDEISCGGTYPARNLYLKVHENMMVGHWHFFDRYLQPQGNGTVEGAWVNACLRTLKPHWQPYNRWVNGFYLIDYSTSGFFHVQDVLFLKRENKLWTEIGGKEYTG